MTGVTDHDEDPERTEELAERLPPGLADALPEVPTVTLFVAVAMIRCGRRARDLRVRFGLRPAQARTIAGYASGRVRPPVR